MKYFFTEEDKQHAREWADNFVDNDAHYSGDNKGGRWNRRYNGRLAEIAAVYFLDKSGISAVLNQSLNKNYDEWDVYLPFRMYIDVKHRTMDPRHDICGDNVVKLENAKYDMLFYVLVDDTHAVPDGFISVEHLLDNGKIMERSTDSGKKITTKYVKKGDLTPFFEFVNKLKLS